MDPLEDLPPPRAFFPSPTPPANAPPPAPASTSLSGPKIFVLSPLPSNKYDVDWYFYSPVADVSKGDYTALLTFAAHYGHPLAICCKPSDQPRDAAQWEECLDLDELSLTTFRR